VTPRDSPPVRKRIKVIVNRRAGTVLEASEQKFEGVLRQAFAAQNCDATIVMADPAEVARHFEAALDDQQVDIAVVAGGDGSVNAILRALRASGKTGGVLPLGTVNVIGRDLGMGQDVAQAVEALASGSPIAVDLATINGLPFHSNAGIGWFVTMAAERDAARRRVPFSRQMAFFLALLRTILTSRSIDVEYETATGKGAARADGVLVTNNRFVGGTGGGASWGRPRLDEGVFELHVVRASTLAARLKTLMAVARGTWRELPNIQTITASHAVLRRRGRRKGRIAMDGELLRLNYPFEFKSEPKAIKVITGRPVS
jgi:YegS/Rv2252/BmrU family lipid kinase